MKHIPVAIVAGVLYVSGSAGYAQTLPTAPHSDVHGQGADNLTPADWNAITNARVAVVKAALQLTPDQMKLWPAVEDAIRARAAARQRRVEALQQMMQRSQEPSAVDLIRMRGEALSQKGESLKKLADAWQPLAASLNPDQKRRLLFLTIHVLREARDATDRNFMLEEDEDED